MVHFDAHLRNVVGDGRAVYLTDFGLVLDPDFDLTDRERAFLARHSHYDYGEAIASVGSMPLRLLGALAPDERERVARTFGIPPGATQDQVLGTLLDRIDEIHDAGDLPVEKGFVDMAGRYREVILFMAGFLTTLGRNPRKDTRYDDAALARLLGAADVET